MTTAEQKKIEIYYDHYKDTFQIQLKYIENRNKYFVIAILMTLLIFFQMAYPTLTEVIFQKWYQKQTLDETMIDFSFIRSILLFGFLWILILYFQINIQIEKQYKYIHKMEMEISGRLAPYQITREGESYKKPFPLVSWAISKIYKFVFPVSIFAVAILRTINEWQNKNAYSIFNITICVLIVIITVLYVFWGIWKGFSIKKS
jgi:hypothetical protein